MLRKFAGVTLPFWEVPLSRKTRQHAGTGQKHHDDPGRHLPNGEEQEARQRERKIARCQDRARPDRVIEGRTENADHGCVGAAHGGLCGGACAHRVPERQHAIDEQHARKENCDEGNYCASKAVWRRAHRGPKIGGEGEERSGHRLCQPVTCQEGLVADPSRRNNLGLQQRQHDMAAAKDQCPRPIERVEQGQRLGAGVLATTGGVKRSAANRTSATTPARRVTGKFR